MYKELAVHIDGKLDTYELGALQTFNDSFRPDEIRLEHDGNRLIILLREVDFSKVQNVSARLSAYTDKGLFCDVVEAVGRIKSYGIKGSKRNYVDYNKERKVKDRKAKEARRNQYFYAQGHAFAKEANPFPPEYANAVLVGDSEDVLKKIPDNCVDMILTSPPYNFGLDYGKNQDDHHWEDYFAKLFRIFRECIRVTRFGGRIVVNVQPLFSDYIPSHHLISNFFLNEKLIWKGEILWEKNNYNCKYTAWGSWKSPSNPYLKYTWEFIEIFCKGDLKKVGKSENIDISGDEFKKWVVAKWSMAPERNMKDYNHPAMFPEELVERVLKLFSYRGDLILDPFNGAGTTTYVAKKLGRKYCGIDVSSEYCKVAEKRISAVKKEMRESAVSELPVY